MDKTIAAIIIAAALLTGCATPAPGPTATPTEGTAAPTATAAPPTEVPTVAPTDTPTSTPATTPTPEPTNTPTAIAPYTLSGAVFFDYNGNGLRDEGEPPIEGVVVRNGDVATTSQADGRYVLGHVPKGRVRIMISSASDFKYLTPSAREAIPIGRGRDVTVDKDKEVLLPLARGPLTWPVCGADSMITYYFDLDNRPDYVENWRGETAIGGQDHKEIHVYDQHPGMDIHAEPGTPVVAMSPGVVEAVIETSEGHDIRFVGDGYWFRQAHVVDPEVEAGMVIERYQVIGYMTDLFSTRDGWWAGDHVHIAYEVCHASTEGPGCFGDPWRYLTVPNTPYCSDGVASWTEY